MLLLGIHDLTAEPLKIIYHSPVAGALQECHCQGGRKGGVARLHAHLEKMRIDTQNTILISPGNWLNCYRDTDGDSLLFRLLPEFGFDALAVGPLDLVGGYPLFAEQGKSDSLPWVCSNLTYQGKSFTRPYSIIKNPWGSVLVTGAISPRRFLEIYPKGIPDGIGFCDPVASLHEAVKAGTVPATITVIVSYLEPEQEKRFLDNWDPARAVLFLRYGEASRLDTSNYTVKRVVAEMGSGGRCVSTVSFDNHGTTMKFSQEILDTTYPQDPAMSHLVDIHYRVRGADKTALKPAILTLGQNRKGPAGKPTPAFTLFYSPDCPDCHSLIAEKLLPLDNKGLLRLDLVDISVPDNYRQLVALQKQKKTVTKNIPVAYFDGKFADGLEAIKNAIMAINRQH